MTNASRFVLPCMLLAVACSHGHEPESEESSFETLAPAVEEAAPLDDRWIAGLDLLDTHLWEFGKNELVPGKHTWSVKYKYEPDRDTLFADTSDSIIVYRYHVDSILEYYRGPFAWTETERRWSDPEAKQSLMNFFDVLATAGSCQGLVYAYGDQMIESFMFSSEEDASNAKRWFDLTHHSVFPKTLSFASVHRSRLYVFHARYNSPSWQSKKDHERFEVFTKKI